MKISKAKLSKMGYSDEDIMKILEVDETQYRKLQKYSYVDRDYIPEKMALASRGEDIDLFKFIRVYDEIFRLNGIDSSGYDMDFKIEAIENFPSLLREIELSKIKSEIESLEDERIKLLEAINKTEMQIKAKQMELESSACKKKVEIEVPTETKEEVIEKSGEERTYRNKDDIKIVARRQNGNVQVFLKAEEYDKIQIGTFIKVAEESGIKRYRVRTKVPSCKQVGLDYVETIFTNAS